MIALIQRVSQARVDIDKQTVARIKCGIVALIGIEKHDTAGAGERLLGKIIRYRIFPDAEKKMNLSLLDTDGELLLIPQFTLAADTRKGTRAGFSPAAPPETGRQLFQQLADYAQTARQRVQTGVFGADMQVTLTNDGPVTFWLQV